MSLNRKLPYDWSARQIVQGLRRKLFRYEKEVQFNDKHPCVFVISTGRVGTETLAALYSLSRNVMTYHEPAPKLYNLSKLAYQKNEDLSAHDLFREAFLLARNELLNYSLSCGVGYIETSPQATFLAPFILDLIPGVRFIHLVRDPREVIRSGMRRKWFDGNSADKTRITPLANSVSFQKWDQYTAFQKNAWLWTETNNWIKQFFSTIPSEHTLFLRSEDVFEADPATLEKLFNFIGAPLPSEKKIHQLLGKKLNFQKTGEFPSASMWTDAMNSDLLTIAGDTARSFGYDLSSAS
jgi:hypothetical protein